MPMILTLAIAAIGGAVFFFAGDRHYAGRNRRNLVHRAANYGRLRTVTGREMPASASVRSIRSCRKLRLVLRINPRMSVEPCPGS